MVITDAEGEPRAEATRMVLEAAFTPWGGSERCIDAYESSIRAATNMHLRMARFLDPGLARSYATTCADVTRDLGAAQVSSARWLLDA